MPRIEINGPDGPEEVHLLREEEEPANAQDGRNGLDGVAEETERNEPLWRTILGVPGVLWSDLMTWLNENIQAVALLIGAGLVVFWIGPRLYERTFISVDPNDSKIITYHQRHWFGATEEIRLTARFDRELKAWRWHVRSKDGSWYPFFREANDYPDD